MVSGSEPFPWCTLSSFISRWQRMTQNNLLSDKRYLTVPGFQRLCFCWCRTWSHCAECSPMFSNPKVSAPAIAISVWLGAVMLSAYLSLKVPRFKCLTLSHSADCLTILSPKASASDLDLFYWVWQLSKVPWFLYVKHNHSDDNSRLANSLFFNLKPWGLVVSIFISPTVSVTDSELLFCAYLSVGIWRYKHLLILSIP